MSQEPQADIDARLDEPAVVDFGGDEEPVRRRPRASLLITAVRQDWRLVPIVAGLSAVAIFASLAGEWQITTLTRPDLFGPGPIQPAAAGIGDLGGFATGYLIGIFGLVACTALVLFGRPAMRDQARILGLTAAGLNGAILISTAVWLDGNSAAISTAEFFIGPEGPGFELSYGRGLTMAFLGVAGLAIALVLAGRLMPAPSAQPATAVVGTDGEPVPRAEAVEPVDWPWRRPRSTEPVELDSDLPPPSDLTVGPTAPFLPMTDGRVPDDKRDA